MEIERYGAMPEVGNRKSLVIFQPSGRRGYIKEGETVKEASRKLGVDIEGICGDNATCGKCKIRIEEGFFEKYGIESRIGHLSPIGEAERKFFKAQEATQLSLPSEGAVLITVVDSDKAAAVDIAKEFINLGFKIKSTENTHRFLADNGIKTERILKMHEGRPNIIDAIKNKEIQLVINTPSGKLSKHDDSYIRKAAIKYKVPYITTTAAASAAVKGIAASIKGPNTVKSLQNYHAGIK